MKLYTPTIDEVLVRYKAISKVERMKCGRPCEGTVWNTIKGTKNVCRAARLNTDSPVSELTRKRIDEALMVFVSRGIERISAWTFVCQLRALFARWTLPYYRDAGWKIPMLELPTFRARPPPPAPRTPSSAPPARPPHEPFRPPPHILAEKGRSAPPVIFSGRRGPGNRRVSE